ncbi:MAG: DUF6515 family protein [Candidatus Cryptobacteroides sp.]
MKRIVTIAALAALLFAAQSAPCLAQQNSSQSKQRALTTATAPSNNKQAASRSNASSEPKSDVKSNQNKQNAQKPSQPSAQRPQQGSQRPGQGAQKPQQGSQRPQQGSQRPQQPSAQRPGQGAQKPQQGAQRPSQPSAQRPPQQRPGPQQGEPAPRRPIAGPQNRNPRPHPARMEPIRHDRPSRFYDPGRHYFGYPVAQLPPHCHRKVVYGVPYYFCDGIYYRLINGRYYVSRPPFGVAFNAAVANLRHNLCAFAYYADTYRAYSTINRNARIIMKQNEQIARNNAILARNNASMSLNSARALSSYRLADRLGLVQSYADASVNYYYDDGVFFVLAANGEYVTIVPPAGAIVADLPDDYDIIEMDSEEYYLVDYTVYRIVVVEGRPYFEVLGQITDDTLIY